MSEEAARALMDVLDHIWLRMESIEPQPELADKLAVLRKELGLPALTYDGRNQR